MQMKNPPHPGELLGDNLAELGWNVTAVVPHNLVRDGRLSEESPGRGGA
jgi:plasmid maintenance system antidote protein VapI